MKLTMVVLQGEEEKELPLEAENVEEAYELARGKLPEGAELVGIYQTKEPPGD